MNALSNAIDQCSFLIAKLVSYGVDIAPGVVSLPLDARPNVSMSLLVHGCSCGNLFHCATSGVKQILRVYLPSRWHTKFESIGVGLSRQNVPPLVSHTQRLPHMRLIVSLLDVIKLVCQPVQVLSLQHVAE